MLLPISKSYFNYALKFRYDVPYVATGFVVRGAVARFPGEPGRKKYPAQVLAALLSLAAGLLGFRMLLTLYIPLALAVLLYPLCIRDRARSLKPRWTAAA